MITETTGSKAEYTKGIIVINITASSMAEETRDLSIVDTNRICSNGRSWKNKYSNDMSKSVSRIYILAVSICYGGE